MLSKYISEQEFTITQVRGVDNSLPEIGDVRNNAINTCQNFLDAIRAYYNKPLIINSGYRCPDVNTKVGGSNTSQHLTGNAADIVVIGTDLKKVFNDIASGVIKAKDGQPLMNHVDQLILENLLNGKTVYSGSWVHIGISKKPRRQKMLAIFENGKANYRHIQSI